LPLNVPDDESKPRPKTDPESDESADSALREVVAGLEATAPAVSVSGNFGSARPSPPSVRALSAGVVVAARYQLDHRLGGGGMGEVWAATHAITRRRVAMKFLTRSASLRPEMRQRFLREARAISMARHPSVVEVLDVFELDGGVPVMVMDLLIGETLGAKLTRDKVLPVRDVASLLLPVVEAVEAAHAVGIVHRDLKPDNIFLTKGEEGAAIKVLDFGIAKLTATEGDAAETGSLTGPGSVVGTPWYMAPEQCYGETNIDQRADIWALGVILYECLAGRRPVEGSQVGQLVKRMLSDSIVPIEAYVPGLAPELAGLIGRMLSHEREERPRDLAEVRKVLAGLAGKGASEDPRPDGKSRELAMATAPDVTLASGDDEREARARWDTGVPHAVPRRPAARARAAPRILAGVLAAVVLGTVGWSLVRFGAHSASAEAVANAPTPRLMARASAGPLPAATATASHSGVGSSAANVTAQASVAFAPAPSAHGGTHVRLAQPLDRAAATLAATVGASAVTGNASASAPPARWKMVDGGLFEEVPF
jgi:tRNA A-37 threonylcarbamoyl transferase component Bud32